MKTNVREDHLLIISDLHIGNPFCDTKRPLIEFLDWVRSTDYSLCINGDGIDISQASLAKLLHDAPKVAFQLSRVLEGGRPIHYVVGNHDIVLEHFVEAWGAVNVVPFLNVQSGDKRIRIEHGHLYDPIFVRMPRTYELGTRFLGQFLRIHPSFYRVAIEFQKARARLYRRLALDVAGERAAYMDAVQEILRRGFDVVSFGHTHQPMRAELGDGKIYVNSGSWIMRPTYVQIDEGEVELKRWEP